MINNKVVKAMLIEHVCSTCIEISFLPGETEEKPTCICENEIRKGFALNFYNPDTRTCGDWKHDNR
jgi:hypothetical protein